MTNPPCFSSRQGGFFCVRYCLLRYEGDFVCRFMLHEETAAFDFKALAVDALLVLRALLIGRDVDRVERAEVFVTVVILAVLHGTVNGMVYIGFVCHGIILLVFWRIRLLLVSEKTAWFIRHKTSDLRYHDNEVI